jgi:hypothetical protein
MANYPKPNVSTTTITRQNLENALGVKDLRLIRNMENSFQDVSQTLPDSVQAVGQIAQNAYALAQQAEADAQQALANAATALAAAQAAAAAAQAAQATATAAQTTANNALTLANTINADYVSLTKTTNQILASPITAVKYTSSATSGGVLFAGTTQLIGQQDTRFTHMTGTPFFGTYNADTTYPVATTYTQSQIQAIAAALTQAWQKLAAMESLLVTHGLEK